MTSVPVLAGGVVGPGNNNEGYYLDWREDVFRSTAQGMTPEQESRLAAAKEDLRNRLGANNGNNSCAKLFGGYDKAIKALNESIFSFVDLGAPVSDTLPKVIHAGTRGRNIYINSQGGFMAVNGEVPTMIGRFPNSHQPNQRIFVTRAETSDSLVESRNDVKFASFVLLHELGHRRKIYGKDDHDAIDDKNGIAMDKTARNNKKILDACF